LKTIHKEEGHDGPYALTWYKGDRDIIKKLFWPSFMKIWLKIWTLECSQGFCSIWPNELRFDPRSTRFNLNQNIIKTIILTKFHEDWVPNMDSTSVYMVFVLFDLLTYFLTQHDQHSKLIKTLSIQSFLQSFMKTGLKCGLYSVHKAFELFDLVTYILTPHDPDSNLTETT
jgi:hypothetical protein